MPDVAEEMERFVELVNAGQHEDALAVIEILAHSEIEFSPVLGVAIAGRAFHGPEEVRGYFRDIFDTFETFKYEGLELRPVSDGVLLFLATVEATGRGSGVLTRQEIGLVIESEDGLIRRANAYKSPAEARAAAEALEMAS